MLCGKGVLIFFDKCTQFTNLLTIHTNFVNFVHLLRNDILGLINYYFNMKLSIPWPFFMARNSGITFLGETH